MSWCDKLSSTPAAGFRLTPSFVEAGHLLNNLQPILNDLYDGDRATFTVEFLNAADLKINTEAGFIYHVSPVMASVTFNHRVRAVPTSAGLPVMELLSKPAPYTSLLDEVIAKLVHLVSLLPSERNRGVLRVGIVSLTNVDFQDSPPGIQELFGKLGRIFGGDVEELNGAFTTRLSSHEDSSERCIHTLNRPQDEKKLTSINLDWQRVFNSPRSMGRPKLEEILAAARQSAMEYFENVAEGGLDDRQG